MRAKHAELLEERFKDRISQTPRNQLVGWMLSIAAGRFIGRLDELRQLVMEAQARSGQEPASLRDAR